MIPFLAMIGRRIFCRLPQFGGWLVLTWGAASLSGATAVSPMTIVANPGRFVGVEAAARAEAQVDWWAGPDRRNADACTECFAAVELRHYVASCLGRPEGSLTLGALGKLPPTGDVFLLGDADSNPLIGLFPESLAPAAPESFRIRAFRQNGRTITIICGHDRVGVLYGAYAYLERLGLRFYGPDERDTVMPAAPVRLPASLDDAEKPDYLTRGFHAWEDRGDNSFFLWMARNRLNYWCAVGSREKICFLKKLGMKLVGGDHTDQNLCLNPDTYFAEHPEWYGLQGGRRSPRILPNGKGDNYCTSNPQATAQLAKNVVQECIDGKWRYADILNLWMTDFGRWCECDRCRAEGTYTDRLLDVTYAVNKALRAAQADGRLTRNVQVATLAYLETLPPPTRPLPADFDYANCSVTFFPIERCYVHALADPACSEVNEAIVRRLQGWTVGSGRHYTGAMFIGEYYGISGFKTLPVLFTRIMATDIPWYYEMGARHFHYMHVPTAQLGTWRLNNYFLGRLLWNVKSDPNQLLDEYFASIYPTTATPMREFYRELEYASENFKAFKSFVYADGRRYTLRVALADEKLPLFPTRHLKYESDHALLDSGPGVADIQAAMGRARGLIDDALIHAGGAKERSRLMEDERRFTYGEAMVDFYYRLIRTAMFHRMGDTEGARREFALAERQAGLLKSIVDLIQVSSADGNAKNGFEATQAEGAFRYYQAMLDPAGLGSSPDRSLGTP